MTARCVTGKLGVASCVYPNMNVGAYHGPDQLIAHALGVAQAAQPWTVPYSARIREASGESNLNDLNDTPPAVPYILGTHTVLHAAKSVGKIAAVYEARDHDDGGSRVVVRGSVQTFADRVREKNGRGFGGEP